MKTRLSITALLGFLFATPAVAQVDSVAICQGKDADFNRYGEYGNTLLHLAAQANACETAARLIAKGFDVNVRNDDGRTPLFLTPTSYFWMKESGRELLITDDTSREHAIQTAELLIAHGADVNARDGQDRTPLMSAARYGSVEISELLIAHGTDVNARDREYRTPLYNAAYNNAVEISELLIAHGADINVRDVEDDAPLHSAASGGAVEVAKLLIAKGADVNALSVFGETPLDSAFKADQLNKKLNKYARDAQQFSSIGKKSNWPSLKPMIDLLRTHGGECNKKCP